MPNAVARNHDNTPKPENAMGFVIADQARKGRPVRFQVEPDGCGVCVTALDDRGRPMATVLLDYFGNRLSALVQRDWEADAGPVHVLVEDVDARRTLDLEGEAICPAGRRPMTDRQRLELMRELYALLVQATESFEQDDQVGPDLAYLLGAVNNDTCCAWPEDRPLVGLLRTRCEPQHPVWNFIALEED